MSYKARIKNNICTNAHPKGCYYNVHEQVMDALDNRINTDLDGKTALVVGASSGIGLASRIALSFAYGMDTLGVYYERAGQAHKFGSAGWYNNQALEYYARRSNRTALSTNQDAFQEKAKDWVIQKLQQQGKKLEVLVYSLAAPRRSIEGVGDYQSTIKPIHENFTGTTLDIVKGKLRPLQLDTATPEEVEATVKVMGGEDWQNWVIRLQKAGVLAENFKTIAYSYLGPEQTQAIYGRGTLGAAKRHLHETAIALDQKLKGIKGRAHIGLFEALVTPSSSVIPSLPLYISALHQIQKQRGTYESTLDQVLRMYRDGFMQNDNDIKIRVDDIERDPITQKRVNELLEMVTEDNLKEIINVDDFRQAFLKQFGFEHDFIDYENKPDPLMPPATCSFEYRSHLSEAV
ncbi:enoyl-[acyl-carrier-protein] reductase FabV [Bermanella marisrubri]|uniref:trans-2-enoyl-CoA reductase (NAD(+)) n=1 Tax=Bermanella marisrubri TaxID=207949 RepID=Q1N691_9GAMM|nr:enoyl-[acyl-carrier-protein] reductase FabV [Bermanella marisrubri]EAT13701.1 hypothetical protein RED65_09924 [Oceanobacter sp. RED65] [Bermanella marisrubri]QIZ84479.1 enoyl-[acyl-carrier-protein] reductase FabV [Bermanella marisrubri]